MNKLKYTNYDIVFQEVPNETMLAINISGCPHKCEGCHSSYLGEYIGDYLSDNIDNIIMKYPDMITCVGFMGGDQNVNELRQLLSYIKNKYNLKTCVYSGSDDISVLNECIEHLDYVKIGGFVEALGGLNSKETNQRFYKIDNKKTLIDITNIFWN